jgi:hypothetical protein
MIFYFFEPYEPKPASGPTDLLPCTAQSTQLASAGGLASLAGAHPSHASRSNPLSVNPT